MKAKVLIVEDSREQREHLLALMQDRGFEARAVGGGIDALKAIKADPPDVVILDVLLDDLDGLSVCRWLRLTESTRDIIVIMLTVKNEVKERIEGLHIGADDYLPKPYDENELEARIYAALRSRVARQELRRRNSELETLLTRTEHLAATDPLTGIPNRRRFLDVLKREFAVSRRYGNSLSCVSLDLDHFKEVNDVGGHSAGDEVLKHVAELLTSSIREVDVCARFGGDEFAMLLPHTPLDKALIVVERIRVRMLALRGTWPGPAALVSISAGIASTTENWIKNPDDLLDAADRALYRAKRFGRDRVALSSTEDEG
jgi:diguanylate cyclase (GGDEF)-like protein